MTVLEYSYRCGGNESDRRCQNRFNNECSGKFEEVINSLMAMVKYFIIRKKVPNFLQLIG